MQVPVLQTFNRLEFSNRLKSCIRDGIRTVMAVTGVGCLHRIHRSNAILHTIEVSKTLSRRCSLLRNEQAISNKTDWQRNITTFSFLSVNALECQTIHGKRGRNIRISKFEFDQS